VNLKSCEGLDSACFAGGAETGSLQTLAATDELANAARSSVNEFATAKQWRSDACVLHRDNAAFTEA
jgi:hypothetical protein